MPALPVCTDPRAHAPSSAPGRLPRRLAAIGLALACAALGACSETSLNEAPIIDRSGPARVHAAAPPTITAASDDLYTVQKGDTLFHLAANAHCTIQDLARWNGIDERAPIFVGQQLRLHAPVASAAAADIAAPAPAMAESEAATEAVATPIPLGSSAVETRTLDAAPGVNGSAGAWAPLVAAAPATTPAFSAGAPDRGAGAMSLAPLPPAAVAVPPAVDAGRVQPAASGAAAGGAAPAGGDAAGTLAPGEGAAPAPGSAAAIGWIWPVSGPVTGKFDPVLSKGIEIAAPEDAAVVAVGDGTVSYTGSPRDYGNLVILKHSDDLLSVYAHNKSIVVKEGQVVHRGQQIAVAGKSATGPSTLHFEVRRNHVPIDPLDVLPLR